MPTRPGTVLPIGKIVTASSVSESLASHSTCSVHTDTAQGFEESVDGLLAMPGCVLVWEENCQWRAYIGGPALHPQLRRPPLAQARLQPWTWHRSWKCRTAFFIPVSRLLAWEQHCLAVKRFIGLYLVVPKASSERHFVPVLGGKLPVRVVLFL